MRRFIPAAIKRPLKSALKRAELATAMACLREGLTWELQFLAHAWNNDGYQADIAYLQEMVCHARSRKHHILECGSGMSTLILGKLGHQVTSLEHHPEWFERMQSVIRRFKLDTVNLVYSPLKSYGEFDWYTAPPANGYYTLVICDGPPSATRGGRYGLMPVMKDQLSADFQIMLDDAERPDEKSVLERWRSEFNTHALICRDAGGEFAQVSYRSPSPAR